MVRHRLASLIAGSLLLAAPLRAQLLHAYRFDNGATDAVGGANGTLFGSAAVANGVLALGQSGYVEFGSKIVPTSGSYSIALFARALAGPAHYTEFISQGYSGGPGLYVGFDPTGQIRATDLWNTTGVSFPFDQLFHHVALVVDASANKSFLYLDGSLAATQSFAIATTALGGSNTRLGRQFDPFTEYFDGQLDNVLIYGNALSAQEVALLASPVSTPEPATVALVGPVLLGVGVARRSRRRGGAMEREQRGAR